MTGILFLVGLVSISVSRASDLPGPYTLDLPFAPNTATPEWLGHPQVPETTFASLILPVNPPDPEASLLVTVYFQEKEGGFLRITWKASGGAQTLADNFYEGIGMSNQRSLLLTPGMMTNQGALCFQTGDTSLGIQRIKLEWLQSKNSLVSPAVQDLLVTPANGVTQLSQTLDGQPRQADPAAWHGQQLVTVPITQVAQRVEDGVEFSFELEGVPSTGRVSFKESGLPLGRHLIVWVNGQRAGTVSPAVPDLTDEGYLANGTAASNYVGWRDGTFFLPVSLLKSGANTLQFSDEAEIPATTTTTPPPADAPLALKDLVLQLAYSAETPVATSTASDGDSALPNAPDTSASTGEILPLTSTAVTLRSTLP